ncbi:MAG TPA: hypothetical protein VJM50_08265 [Pyrinomonadaceae bacterium]|nr:hypothetical protein [Pyrinomonadaceae bacterium]
MTSSTHISVETLANIAEGTATSVVREAAMAHISTCSMCHGMLRRLQQLILMMRTDSTNDAPRDVLTTAINIFSQEKPSPLRRIVALLTFDSRNAGPAYGVRSHLTASRQMLYSAEETDVELRITVQNDECTLAGQVIGEGCAGGHVEISGEAGRSEATLNEECEFKLPPIPIGNYSLIVRMLDRQIEIPELELKV